MRRHARIRLAAVFVAAALAAPGSAQDGLAGPAPGEPGGTHDRRDRREPSPYDAGWFTDADELALDPATSAAVRRYLDQALRTGRPGDVAALRWIDVDLATPAEKARLVDALTRGPTGARERAWLEGFFARYAPQPPSPMPRPTRGQEGHGGLVLDLLGRAGRLEALVGSHDDLAFHDRLAALATTGPRAAALVRALVGSTDRDARKLAAHHVLDAARAQGALHAATGALTETRGGAVRRVVLDALAWRKPLVIGHRGDPIAAAENTVPAIEAAARNGADGVELDLCLTRDGEVVLWHDASPAGFLSVLRNLGLEGGVPARPTWPNLGASARRPVHELTTAEVRRELGYAGPNVGQGAVVPTLDEALAACKRAGLRRVFLDLKVPGDLPLASHQQFGRRIGATLDRHGLRGCSVLMTPDEALLRRVQAATGPMAATLDVEITNAIVPGGDHSAVREAVRLGNAFASIGRPVVPKLGGQYSYYLTALRRDRARIGAEDLDVRLVTWTLDDELELREVIGVGVHEVLTNKPALLRDVIRRLGL